MREPKLYHELADWWPLLSGPDDYAEEAGFYRDILIEACAPRTVLELGSGGGNNAFHMKRHFDLTLVDRSEAMIEVSRSLNPECEHHRGDMRTIRLDRRFDAVFVHDAVMYLTTEDDLLGMFRTAQLHCRPGGAMLIAPDDFLETLTERVSSGGHDGDGRALRYLQWNRLPDPGATTFLVDFAYLLRRGETSVEVVHDRHELGVFPREVWLELSRRSGFEPEIRRVVHSELAPRESELILCRRGAT